MQLIMNNPEKMTDCQLYEKKNISNVLKKCFFHDFHLNFYAEESSVCFQNISDDVYKSNKYLYKEPYEEYEELSDALYRQLHFENHGKGD